MNRLTYGPKIWWRYYNLDNISNKFEGQGHRSKVKVARLENLIFEVSGELVSVHSVMTCRHVTSRCDVLTSSDNFWQEY